MTNMLSFLKKLRTALDEDLSTEVTIFYTDTDFSLAFSILINDVPEVLVFSESFLFARRPTSRCLHDVEACRK